ncbi:MAG: ester cyclase [Actinomycetota bacterium]
MTAADVAAAKAIVWDLSAPLMSNAAPWPDRLPDRIAADVDFHGPAPIGRCSSRAELDERFFGVLRRAMPRICRQPHLFLGGQWGDDTWVASTGDYVGPLAEPLCGITPAGSAPVRLRFGEFCRVIDGEVAEIRCLVDLPGLAAQVGVHLLPPFPAKGEPPPGPALGNGVVRGTSDPVETAYTLQLVEDMLGGCNRLDGSDLESMGMAAYWHPDMVWHGPWGVGSSYGFDEFQNYAQGPSVRSFPDRRGGFHQARFADGLTAAFTGWPSLQGTFSGDPFRGVEPTGGPIGQNIMDFYVRRDDKLHENWVLIDLVDFAAQCGVDLLAPLDH